jgi:hypothetical protein
MAAVFDGEDPGRYLSVVLPSEYQQRIEHRLRQLELPEDAFERARSIHEWIENHVLFGGLPAQKPYYRVLDFGAGVCIQQIRLFVAMCRMAGVAAREVCGALLPLGGEELPSITKELRARGSTPFGHSWAEFFVPDRGWVPTELRGFGRRGFIPLTCPDPELRREIQRVLYERYPFGTLHPYRIVSGKQANRLAPLHIPRGADATAVRRALDSLSVEISCRFTRKS